MWWNSRPTSRRLLSSSLLLWLPGGATAVLLFTDCFQGFWRDGTSEWGAMMAAREEIPPERHKRRKREKHRARDTETQRHFQETQTTRAWRIPVTLHQEGKKQRRDFPDTVTTTMLVFPLLLPATAASIWQRSPGPGGKKFGELFPVREQVEGDSVMSMRTTALTVEGHSGRHWGCRRGGSPQPTTPSRDRILGSASRRHLGRAILAHSHRSKLPSCSAPG
jgi:hypothetical protein